MTSQRTTETFVGLFLLIAMLALMVLAFKVSGLTSFLPEQGYTIVANFDEIGGLKVRAPVKISGVQVGTVTSIGLDPSTFKAVVKMRINKKFNDISDDSSATILTAGLLGDNYIAINPMYNKNYLKNGSEIQDTHPAIILEKLIGQLIFKLTNTGGEKNANS